MKNKILWIINEYAGSIYHGMEFRHYYLAIRLQELGYRVVIISGSYSHLYQKQPDCKSIVEHEVIDGIDYYWIRVINYGASTSKKRILKWFQFSSKLFLLGFINIQKPDYILLSPMATLPVVPGYLLAKLKKSKFLIEIKDIWPLTLMEIGGYSKHNPFIWTLRKFEVFGLTHADAIISNIPGYGAYLTENHIKRSFTFIPNGIDLRGDIEEQEIPKELGSKVPLGKFVVGYAGTVGLANGLEYLIEAAKILKYMNQIVFVIVGDGSNKRKIVSKASDLQNVIFLPAIPRQQIQSVLRKFDVCFIGWRRKDFYKYGVAANKLFDYMLSGKPILESIDSKLNLVDQASCGLCVESESPRAIADGVLKLFSMSKDELQRLGNNGKEYVLKYHTYTTLAKQLKEVLDGLESAAF